MIAHVATLQGTVAQFDDFSRKMRREIAPTLRSRTGFIESIVLVDNDAGRALLITLWESRTAVERSNEEWQREGATHGASAEVGLRRTAAWYEVADIVRPKPDASVRT